MDSAPKEITARFLVCCEECGADLKSVMSSKTHNGRRIDVVVVRPCQCVQIEAKACALGKPSPC